MVYGMGDALSGELLAMLTFAEIHRGGFHRFDDRWLPIQRAAILVYRLPCLRRRPKYGLWMRKMCSGIW